MTAAILSVAVEASSIDALTTQLLRLAERTTQVSLLNQSAGQGPRYTAEIFELCALVLVGAHFLLRGGPTHEVALWQASALAAAQAAEAELQRVQPDGPVASLPATEPHPLIAALPVVLPPSRLFAGEGGIHG